MTNFRRLPKLLYDAFKQAFLGYPGLIRDKSKILPGQNSFGYCPYCGKRLRSKSSSQIHRCWHCEHIFLVKAFYQVRK